MLETFLLNQTALFTLVLGRIGALIASAPVIDNRATPIRVKVFLAVALSLLIVPTQSPAAISGQIDVPQFAGMIFGEVVIGLLLGLGVTILLSGVQVAGQVVSQMSGMALGDVFDPSFDDSVSIFSQLFYFVALAVYVAIGGHRMTMDALLQTFTWTPPGEAVFDQPMSDALIALLAQSFNLGLRAAAPLMIALFLATVVLGLISRTLPQINTIVVGFSLNGLLTLSMLFLTIGSVAWTFQEPLSEALVTLQEATIRQEVVDAIPNP